MLKLLWWCCSICLVSKLRAEWLAALALTTVNVVEGWSAYTCLSWSTGYLDANDWQWPYSIFSVNLTFSAMPICASWIPTPLCLGETSSWLSLAAWSPVLQVAYILLMASSLALAPQTMSLLTLIYSPCVSNSGYITQLRPSASLTFGLSALIFWADLVDVFLPVNAVKGNEPKARQDIPVQTADIDIEAVRMGSGAIKRVNPTNTTKSVLGDPCIESISC